MVAIVAGKGRGLLDTSHRGASDFTVIDPGVVRVRVRTQAKDVQSITIHAGATPRVAFEQTGTEQGYDVWSAVADLNKRANSNRVEYVIELIFDSGVPA